MREYASLIARHALLGAVSPGETQAHLKDGRFIIRSYAKNNILHLPGEPCLKQEFLLSGRVSVERIDEAGNLMTIAEFRGGELLGGSLLFSREPVYPMTITARQPALVLEIDRDSLLDLFAKNQAFLRSYLEFTADHTAHLGRRIQYYVNRTIRDCILTDLARERQRQNSDRITLPLTKKAWAERMGVQRTSLSRELAKMRSEGLIRFDGKSIELL